jgi:site-specific DNA recombinase
MERPAILWPAEVAAMSAEPARDSPTRCAIYTRKSSEEGLDQTFNSLDAQREACEAFAKSQAHEGWVIKPEPYDDGGYSGGSMDRPALQRLLADIEAGLVDVVLVYKIDRLTRSLLDFAAIVERFDRHGVSFAAVTQQFSTTTSMGRLTLNVLLSFAQFEREVTGERIRDKIAASKKKGMWMGGLVPLGYDAKDKSLVVNPAEAETVRTTFRLYLELGAAPAVLAELERRGLRSKARMKRRTGQIEQVVFGRGALYHLLGNRTYLGEIPHRAASYPGRHQAIIERALFDAVQAKMSEHRVIRGSKPKRSDEALLTGRIFDDQGRPYTPSFAYGRGGRRYRYYVRAEAGPARRPGRAEAPPRLPGPPSEAIVLAALQRLSGREEPDWTALLPMLLKVEVGAERVRLTLDSRRIDESPVALVLDELQGRLQLGERAALAEDGVIIVILPGRFHRRGGRTWCSADLTPPRVDATLVKALRSAHAIAEAQGFSPLAPNSYARACEDPYQDKLSRLVFLAPDIQQAILDGRQPPGLTLQQLMRVELPIDWNDQRRQPGIGS